jgi:hypothetical protein
MDLNKEAEEFLKSNNVVGMTELICPIIIEFATNSKYVQAKVLQTQIDYIENEMLGINYEIRKVYIDELKEQLKELENE